MLEKYNRYQILKVFMDSPNEKFGLRETARLSKVSPPSVMAYLKEFEAENLIKKEIKRKIPFYSANRDNPNFILYKKISILFELNKTGAIDYMWEKTAPEAIVLYGSFAKGESIEDSDIDLFILGKEKRINLTEFEKKLGKKIHVLYENSLGNVSKELRNNILNGIILKGYIKVFSDDNKNNSGQRKSKINFKTN